MIPPKYDEVIAHDTRVTRSVAGSLGRTRGGFSGEWSKAAAMGGSPRSDRSPMSVLVDVSLNCGHLDGDTMIQSFSIEVNTMANQYDRTFKRCHAF